MRIILQSNILKGRLVLINNRALTSRKEEDRLIDQFFSQIRMFDDWYYLLKTKKYMEQAIE